MMSGMASIVPVYGASTSNVVPNDLMGRWMLCPWSSAVVAEAASSAALSV